MMDNFEPENGESLASRFSPPSTPAMAAPGMSAPPVGAPGMSAPPMAAPGMTAPPMGARFGGAGTSLIGREVGNYRVEVRIGGGAMASVYRGIDLRTGHSVALKILLSDADDTVRERFRLEAQMVGTLDHPHIVRTLDVSPTTGDDGLTFIAMELVQGQSLADLLDNVHTLNVADSCALLAPVARALTYAHSKNVVHRDVKPSNILLRRVAPGAAHAVRLTVLDDPVVPLLSDFGIARALDAPDLTTAGRTIGTPAYMSPEQCAGTREIDGRADIYALGAVLYRCLVGRAPYTGTTTQILYAHVYDSLTIPDDVLRLLSPLMVEILRRSMAKDPADRYASAGELAADLGVGAGGPARSPRTPRAAGVQLSRQQTDESTDPPAEQTMTLPGLAAAPAPREALRVLIPAPTVTPTAPLPAVTPAPVATPTVRGSLTGRALSAAPTKPPHVATPGASATVLADSGAVPYAIARWRGVFVGLSLAIPIFVLLALAVGALLEVGPFHFGRNAGDADPAAVVSTSTTLNTVAPTTDSPAMSEATAPPGEIAPTPAAPAQEATAAGVVATSAPVPSAPTPAPAKTPMLAPTPGSTPAGDINAYWQDAQALYAQEDWSQAAAFLTLVQRINTNFETVRVTDMLFESHLRTALQSLHRDDLTAAADALKQAVALRPDNQAAQVLARSTAAAAAQPGDAAAVDALRAALASEGAARLGHNDPCAAADVMEAALALPRDSTPAEPARADIAAVTDVRGRCNVIRQAQADTQILASLPGSLLYSTQTGPDSYRIYSVLAAAGSTPAEIIADGRQPALSPTAPVVAFHSTRPDVVGIAGFDLGAGSDPTSRSILYTRGPGDAVDSPPSWNATGDRFVYAAVDPADQRSRILTVAADGRDTPQLLRAGLSPAWNPVSDLLVFNGSDQAGLQPGLWLMRADGSEATPLTDNGADIRPTWSPDGGAIAFMSNGRSNDWDVYRLNLNDGIVMQLTTESSQDGLPTISPDGGYLAFVSDRGGSWNIWVKPLAGGGSLLLAPIEGSLTNWLEHSLQWIP